MSRDAPGIASVPIRHIQLGALESLKPVVITQIRNLTTVRRDRGCTVGPNPVGELSKRSVGESEFVDFPIRAFESRRENEGLTSGVHEKPPDPKSPLPRVT